MGSSKGAPEGVEAAPYLRGEDRGPERPGSGPKSPSRRGAKLNGTSCPTHAPTPRNSHPACGLQRNKTASSHNAPPGTKFGFLLPVWALSSTCQRSGHRIENLVTERLPGPWQAQATVSPVSRPKKPGSERPGNLLKVTQPLAQAQAQVRLLPPAMPLHPWVPALGCLWIHLPVGRGTCKPEQERLHVGAAGAQVRAGTATPRPGVSPEPPCHRAGKGGERAG